MPRHARVAVSAGCRVGPSHLMIECRGLGARLPLGQVRQLIENWKRRGYRPQDFSPSIEVRSVRCSRTPADSSQCHCVTCKAPCLPQVQQRNAACMLRSSYVNSQLAGSRMAKRRALSAAVPPCLQRRVWDARRTRGGRMWWTAGGCWEGRLSVVGCRCSVGWTAGAQSCTRGGRVWHASGRAARCPCMRGAPVSLPACMARLPSMRMHVRRLLSLPMHPCPCRSDTLALVVKLLRENAAVLGHLRSLHTHILVDEFQASRVVTRSANLAADQSITARRAGHAHPACAPALLYCSVQPAGFHQPVPDCAANAQAVS